MNAAATILRLADNLDKMRSEIVFGDFEISQQDEMELLQALALLQAAEFGFRKVASKLPKVKKELSFSEEMDEVFEPTENFSVYKG